VARREDHVRAREARCQYCGARLELTETVWAKLADGSLHASALRLLGERSRANAVAFWHVVCDPEKLP